MIHSRSLDMLKLVRAASLLSLAIACSARSDPRAFPATKSSVPSRDTAQRTRQSTFFSTAAEEAYSTDQLPGGGDLWPSCWADDDDLYTANGDGIAFNHAAKRYDMAVSSISGMPPALNGHTIATDVGTNWSGPKYNRKPTGMLCTNGAIYLAFQNLSLNFVDAPAASIAKSTDHGQMWTWNKDACYRLVGVIRMHWKGLSGGAEVWTEIGRFFSQLRHRAEVVSGVPHA